MLGIAARTISIIRHFVPAVAEKGRFVRNVLLPWVTITTASGTLAWNHAGAIEPAPALGGFIESHAAHGQRASLPSQAIDTDESPPTSFLRSSPIQADEAPGAARTPMEEDEAAIYLAAAWRSIFQMPIDGATLAILWSHWALETGRGQRMVRYNFAGLKGTAPAGGSVQLWTQEKEDEAAARVRRRFRAYSSPEEGARDYILLLKSRYPRALRAANRGSPIDFVRALEEGNYFTEDPERYLRAVISLWREFLEDQVAEADTSADASSSEG
jgi:hypothetical protein